VLNTPARARGVVRGWTTRRSRRARSSQVSTMMSSPAWRSRSPSSPTARTGARRRVLLRHPCFGAAAGSTS
jgi:hypothetical protein